MSGESAKRDIKGSFGKDFVVLGTDRIEVTPDGQKVTVYTNDGLETKAASGAATQGISISADFNTVVLNGATIERAADGHLVISSSGTVITRPGQANGSVSKAAPEIGAIVRTGATPAYQTRERWPDHEWYPPEKIVRPTNCHFGFSNGQYTIEPGPGDGRALKRWPI